MAEPVVGGEFADFVIAENVVSVRSPSACNPLVQSLVEHSFLGELVGDVLISWDLELGVVDLAVHILVVIMMVVVMPVIVMIVGVIVLVINMTVTVAVVVTVIVGVLVSSKSNSRVSQTLNRDY